MKQKSPMWETWKRKKGDLLQVGDLGAYDEAKVSYVGDLCTETGDLRFPRVSSIFL